MAITSKPISVRPVESRRTFESPLKNKINDMWGGEIKDIAGMYLKNKRGYHEFIGMKKRGEEITPEHTKRFGSMDNYTPEQLLEGGPSRFIARLEHNRELAEEFKVDMANPDHRKEIQEHIMDMILQNSLELHDETAKPAIPSYNLGIQKEDVPLAIKERLHNTVFESYTHPSGRFSFPVPEHMLEPILKNPAVQKEIKDFATELSKPEHLIGNIPGLDIRNLDGKPLYDLATARIKRSFERNLSASDRNVLSFIAKSIAYSGMEMEKPVFREVMKIFDPKTPIHPDLAQVRDYLISSADNGTLNDTSYNRQLLAYVKDYVQLKRTIRP
jgi:hypothetical protein